MKILILEACRSPEIRKKTEGLILSCFFTEQGIDYELYSNDGIWSEKVLNKQMIEQCLKKPGIEIVHLAMHGNDDSFVLRWSKTENISSRFPVELLTDSDIRTINQWQGKLVVSGACNSSKLASSFLASGVKGFIAPSKPVPWANLGSFFQLFYQALFSSQEAITALDLALSDFPEFESYRLYTK